MKSYKLEGQAVRGPGEVEGASFPDIFDSLATGREFSDRVLRKIIEGLLEGRFKPGCRVVARQLAEELGVSIVPVREAIHILAGEGVIELSARKGARIRYLDREEVGNWWEIHGAIGKLGVGIAAQRIARKKDSAEKVLAVMALIRETAGQVDGFEFVMIVLRYHMVLHETAQMPELNDAIRRLGIFFWVIFFPEYIPIREYAATYIENHQRVTDAIVSGDPAAAEAAYQYHIDWSDALIAGERPNPRGPWIQHRHR
jgi:DNA-binding GntR family transcriptional regulator